MPKDVILILCSLFSVLFWLIVALFRAIEKRGLCKKYARFEETRNRVEKRIERARDDETR